MLVALACVARYALAAKFGQGMNKQLGVWRIGITHSRYR